MIACTDCGARNEPHQGPCRSCGRSLGRNQSDEVITSGTEMPSNRPGPLDRTQPAHQPVPAMTPSSREGVNQMGQRLSRPGAWSRTSSGVELVDRERVPGPAWAFATRQLSDPDRDARSPSCEPPLPPLPDGGLAASMPAWLRDPDPPTVPPTEPEPEVQTPDPCDTSTFLSEDDFPEWLRRLAATLPRDSEGPRAPQRTAPSPLRLSPPPDEEAIVPEPPKRTPLRHEAEPPPDEQPVEGRTRTVLAPVPSRVAETIEPPAQVSEPLAIPPVAEAEEMPPQGVKRLAQDRLGREWLAVALLLAAVALVLLYLLTSGWL